MFVLTESSMKLLDFVKQLNPNWVLAPIYRKGASMRSGREATGKNPLEIAFDKDLGPADVALQLEKNKNLSAVGLFTGHKGRGIVILDVDANLGALQRKWGDSLAGAPKVTSTRKNAAKFIFQVPEELWGDVDGFGHGEDHNSGYEVLWGRQGLIRGEYPGSKDGKWPAGEYSFSGDPEAVPVAPEWLLAEMKAAKTPETWIKNRTALDLSDRTEDEVAVIITECLDVVEHRGAGSRDHWVKVGMAIHSVLPGDLGLELWSKWSAKDVEFADEWERGNPCEQPWNSFKPGRIGLGSLIYLADRVDPKRTRCSVASKQILEAAEAARIQQYREVTLSFDEIIRRGMAIYEGDDVARMNYELHALAMEARYKDQSGVEKLLLDHITEQNRSPERSMDQRESKKREYLIPGLLPRAYTLLFFGEPGCGKSATAVALMKCITDQIPFKLKNQVVPVEQGKVVYFTSDMSNDDFDEEFDLHDVKNTRDFIHVPDFNLYRRVQFVKTMNRIKPKMICIDSLSSCSGAKAGDENKAEFAQPLYWLNLNNGVLWPHCVIIVLHHAARGHGGARGSTAISAAVAEVWSIKKPDKDSGLSVDQRVITVGKSRTNRSGETLIQTQEEDLTVSLVEAKKNEEMQTRAGSIGERIMHRLQTKDEWVSRMDLNSDPLVGGKTDAIKKTLQRLENRGVVEVKEEHNPAGGSPTKFYRALRVRAQGESIEGGQQGQNPVGNSRRWGDTKPSAEKCPPSVLSTGAASQKNSNPSPHIRARGEDERTQDEVNATINQRDWDDPVQPMERIEAIEAMADTDNCIDVKADDVIDV